jgi:hypothetical protein
MIFLRKLIAFLVVLFVLWTALTPASGVQLWAILVPFLLFAGILVSAPVAHRPEKLTLPSFDCLVTLTSRAPPLA